VSENKLSIVTAADVVNEVLLISVAPLAIAAHFNPVASALSAVILCHCAYCETAASLVAVPATRSPLAAGAIELAVALLIAISYLPIGFLLLLL
jgi:hypothetical protein